MRSISIRVRILGVVVAALALSAATLVVWVSSSYEKELDRSATDAVSAAAATFRQAEVADVEKLSAALEILDTRADIKQAFAARDREALLKLAAPLFDKLRATHNITHWYFIEPAPTRTCFLRVHKPDTAGDRIDRPTLLRAVETGRVSSGKELGKTAFALRVVRPYRDGDKLLGYIELGEEIDHFVGRMRGHTGDHIAVLVEKRRLDRGDWVKVRELAGLRDTWDELPNLVSLSSTLADARVLGLARDPATLAEGGAFLGRVEREGGAYLAGMFPIMDAAKERVGGVLVLRDIRAIEAVMKSDRQRVLGVLLALLVVTSVVLLALVNRLVFSRLEAMMARMEDISLRLAGGDFSVGDEAAGAPPRDDEIGRFEAFFTKFVSTVASTFKMIGPG